MANKFGFASLNQQINLDSSTSKNFSREIEELKESVIYARVVDIILNDQHPDFNKNGGWSGVGNIYFDKIELSSVNTKSNLVASPLLPYLKNYPLVNEFVLLFKLPSKNVAEKTNITQYYYLNPISIWNNQHINAYPDLITNPQVQPSQQKSYQAIEQGQTRKSSDEEINYNYNSPLIGGTFIERSNIHPLLAFAGDIITEGRWGNSLRFGSTAKVQSGVYTNNWSNTGEDGNPITILRNGQPEEASDEGYLPIIEDINKDLSSIYMTSYQQIPLRAANENYSALSPEPLLPREYFNPQIILNSGRLIFNAASDSILASAQDSISLSSNNQIGITSDNVNISADTIKIGGPSANDPALLGGAFIDQFKILLEQIQVLAFACSGLEGYDSESTNIESSGIDAAGQALDETCKNILDLLPNDNKITSPLLSNTIRLK